ncbi:hypothetical protein BDY19DRAFT_953143 [Irpex rosettiformis]|uniref:Uncharacterized protein n=1 Tax=Irpex rosettiformis TaxID=378272 RepID=A0ACB8U0B9_9APHY|nr:hypothetical protein BDY19DRAFT_953143 [Irpex rosettiformis]
MSSPPPHFTPGSLYIAGFAQARAPHLALIIPKDAQSGSLVHIRIDRSASPTWQYEHRRQKIQGDMFFSSLMKIHDFATGDITVNQLCEAASAVPVPDNDQFGECGPWVFKTIEKLHEMGVLTLVDVVALEKEFGVFAEGNRAYARRDRFPNVAVSLHCT